MEMSSCKSEGIENEDYHSMISLRPLELSDIDEFMEWTTDDKVTRFCTWEPYTSREEAISFIKDKAIPHPWYRAICLYNKPVGAISITENKGNDKCRGELGYALGSNYWGKGIVTHAVKLATTIIFKDWPHLERLEALVDVDNVASQKVLIKSGFQKEGVLKKYFILKGKARDFFMFSLLSTDV